MNEINLEAFSQSVSDLYQLRLRFVPNEKGPRVRGPRSPAATDHHAFATQACLAEAP